MLWYRYLRLRIGNAAADGFEAEQVAVGFPSKLQGGCGRAIGDVGLSRRDGG